MTAKKKSKESEKESKPKKRKGNISFSGFFKFIFLLFILLGALVLFRNQIVKFVLIKGLKTITGVNLELGYLNIAIDQPTIEIKDVQLYNPPGYEDEFMAYAPEVFIAYDLKAMLQGKVHFDQIQIDLEHLMIVKNSQGKLNVHALKALKRKTNADPTKPRRSFRIALLNLKMGQVVYKDYTKHDTLVKTFDLNVEENFQDINTPKGLISLIVWRAATKTTISTLSNFDFSQLEQLASGSLIATPITLPVKVLNKTSNTLKQSVEGLTDAVKKTFGKKDNE